MPPEIADSDAESDLGSPHRPSASPIPENFMAQLPMSSIDLDPFANLEFDQFLSPTQRFSSAAPTQEVAPSGSSGSTNKFLKEIAQADHGVFESTANTQGLDGSMEQSSNLSKRSKAKRTLSDIEGSHTKSRDYDELREKSVKRVKTYGSSRSQRSDTNGLFTDTGDFSFGQGDSIKGQPIRRSETTSNELPVQPLVNPDESSILGDFENMQSIERIRPPLQRGATSFVQGNIQNTSVTKSFIGGYEGINMDFRGVGLSLDMSANPFGSLSQVSLDGDIDRTQTERFTSLFHHSQQSSTSAPAVELDAAVALKPSHLNEMATSPLQRITQGSGATNQEHSSILPSNESAKPAPKKRGRKSKTDKISAEDPAKGMNVFERLQSEDPLDIPQEQYKPRPSRSRAGTVDLTDQVSQSSQTGNTSSLKRKRSGIPDATEDLNGKVLSSELNLSDPAMIGAPKEMYLPRPSKSRAKRVIEDEEDELQKENNSIGKTVDKVALPDPKLVIELDSAPPISTKKKPGRKSKVKRAKTSAAALLKSAEMYDEDDKDCIIVDEIPVKVKMAPLPEIGIAKREPKDEDEEKEHHVGKEGTYMGGKVTNVDKVSNEVIVSVDIPKLPRPDEIESAAPKPEPKKRGRKPKKKAETQVNNSLVEEDQAQIPPSIEISTNDSSNTRSALSEKDPNTTPSTKDTTPQPQSKSTSTSTSPQKPIHSPLKPTLNRRDSTPSTNPLTLTASVSTSSKPNTLLWSKPRVGLSRRTAIPSLLRKLDRSKEGPKVIERKEKLTKRQAEEEEKRKLQAADLGEEYVDKWELRGKDGMLVEWDE